MRDTPKASTVPPEDRDQHAVQRDTSPAKDGPSPALSRRAALQGLAAGFALPFAVESPVEAQRPAEERRTTSKTKSSAAKAEFLDAHQFATLAVVAELIVPGAKATASDRFIDSVLAVENSETQQRFLSALGAFDGAAVARHRKPFKELPEAEQIAVLEAMSTEAPPPEEATATAARGDQNGGGQSADQPPANLAAPTAPKLRAHFDHLKSWVSRAYYTSEAGMKELGWTGNVFHPSYPGCPHPDGHK